MSFEEATDRGSSLFGVSAEQFQDWRWQMGRQVATAEEAMRCLALSSQEVEGFGELKEIFHAGVTPYYFSLINPERGDHCPIRRQALPHADELNDLHGLNDPLDETGHSPVKEVVHVYPDRVAFCVAQLCPVYCRYCFRKRRDSETGLHFNRRVVADGLAYIASNPAIRDVLITGGDPFLASDSALVSLVEKVRRIPHVDIIRFGTRTPVTLPYRVTANLGKALAQFHPLYVNTHFNCVEELTAEAHKAVANLVDHGIPVGNQSVLLRGVNDSLEQQLSLLRGLLKMRVKPYYLFHPHLVAGTAHLRVSLDEGLAIMRGLRGKITGMGIPQYIIDTPSGKIPVTPDHILGRDGNDLLLSDLHGEIWREKGVLGKQQLVY